MKRISFLLSIIIIFSIFTTGVYAASNDRYQWGNNYSNQTNVKFYVQLEGAVVDTNGNIKGRPVSNYTGQVASSTLYKRLLKTFNKAFIVESKSELSNYLKVPNVNTVINGIRKEYYNVSYIKDNEHKIVPWIGLTTDNYDIFWYVLKLEDDAWHVDGVLIDKHTNQPVEIITPLTGNIPKEIKEIAVSDDPTPVLDPTEQIVETPEPTKQPSPKKEIKYKSNYAYIFGYDDTTMAAENPLIRCEVSQMIYRLVKQNDDLDGYKYNYSATPVYEDAKNQWFRSGVEYLRYKNANTNDTNISPYEQVTRGETFKLICLGMNFTNETDLSIEDYTTILANGGVIEGDENGDYLPNKLVTRAEFCTMFNRILGRDCAELVTADGIVITADTYGFKDLKTNKWYYKDMLKATSAYDDNGYVDLELRGRRNNLDDYE